MLRVVLCQTGQAANIWGLRKDSCTPNVAGFDRTSIKRLLILVNRNSRGKIPSAASHLARKPSVVRKPRHGGNRPVLRGTQQPLAPIFSMRS